MFNRDAIVNPVKGKNPPKTGSVAIIVATPFDVQLLASLSSIPVVEQRKLYMSNLQVHANERSRYTIVGPLVGAPYAAMIVEALSVWGVKKIVFVGWCGAIYKSIKVGDIILPERAIVDEGTSGNYTENLSVESFPSRELLQKVLLKLQLHETTLHRGAVWTTDAIFRETVEKVKHYQSQGALAVEMEMSAIFTVATFRDIESAGILAVSDELSDYSWKPGFRAHSLKTAREEICIASLTLAKELGG